MEKIDMKKMFLGSIALLIGLVIVLYTLGTVAQILFEIALALLGVGLIVYGAHILGLFALLRGWLKKNNLNR